MADNFASYFPVTVTGGTTNPMAGADAVQGQNPTALGLDPIIRCYPKPIYSTDIYTIRRKLWRWKIY
jgi:hypothetical protein